MHLVIEIGNSNIVIAIYNEKQWLHIFRYETKEDQPQIFYERGLSDILLEWNVKISEIKNVTVSSVVPNLNQKIMNGLAHLTGVKPLLINAEILKKLPIEIPLPNEIGTDLVCNAIAAIHKYHDHCIIVDFGTALTFTIVEKEIGIIGVTFAPGIKTAFNALASQTALLPEVDLEWPQTVIGKSTKHAIQAGIMYGYEGLVKHILSRIKKEVSFQPKTIATGGISESIKNITKDFDFIDKQLTLEGARIIGEMKV